MHNQRVENIFDLHDNASASVRRRKATQQYEWKRRFVQQAHYTRTIVWRGAKPITAIDVILMQSRPLSPIQPPVTNRWSACISHGAHTMSRVISPRRLRQWECEYAPASARAGGQLLNNNYEQRPSGRPSLSPACSPLALDHHSKWKGPFTRAPAQLNTDNSNDRFSFDQIDDCNGQEVDSLYRSYTRRRHGAGPLTFTCSTSEV